MKGKMKRIAALITMMILVLSSTLVVNASNSTTIKRTTKVSDATALNHTEVKWTGTSDTEKASRVMEATFATKREDDVFDVYQLVDITVTTDSTTGITSLKVEWAAPVKTFIANNATLKALDATEYAKYATPEAMGFYTIAKDKTDATAVAKQAKELKEAEERAIKLLRLLKEDTTTLNALANSKANGATTVGGTDGSSYKVASVNKSMFAQTLDASGNVTAFKQFAYTAPTNAPEGVTVTASQGSSGDPVVYTGITAYTLKNLPFGLYFINASNPDRTNQGGYQPVLANLMPEQTGPTGVWYRNNTNTLYLKNEGLKVTKLINGDKSDVVRVGEIVTFRVEIQIPQYMKKSDGTFAFTTFSAVDDMSTGFTLIPTSAKLSYWGDGTNVEYHPNPSLTTVGSASTGNLSASDPTEKTYNAYLIGTAIPFYNSGDASQTEYFYGTISEDSTTEQKMMFWTIADGALTPVREYTFTKSNGVVNYAFTASMITQINDARPADDKIPSTLTAANFTKKDITKSLIGITFDYAKLMTASSYLQGDARTAANSAAYVKSNAFTVPDKFVVTYDAIVNDDFEIGTDNNTNVVRVFYVEDSTGKISELNDEVVAWSYDANIVKVDGEAYEKYQAYQALTDEQKAAAQVPSSPYLAGAKFDVYKYDATYCNTSATTKTTTPNTAALREGYTFYSDESGAVFATADTSAQRYANARTTFMAYTGNGEFKKALLDSLTSNGVQSPTAIGTAFAAAIGADDQSTTEVIPFETGLVGDYSKLEGFTNKYNYTKLYTETSVKKLKDQYSVNIFNDYMRPHAQLSTDWDDFMTNDDFTGANAKFVQYNPVWQESGCAFNSTPHWHIEAYALFYSDVTSKATAGGVDVSGLDYGKYIMIETAAPEGGYNKLDTAMYFELNPWNAEEHDGKNTGCITEEYDHEDGNEASADTLDDGVYKFVVQNFTGLQLPSTGGMGTLLFTIIGVIIMAAAIIFVVMKNRKIAKNAAAFMMMALVVVATITSTTITSNAVKSINVSESGAGAVKATKDGKATFTIHLKDQYDTIEVYKIADIEYDETNNKFKELAWDTSIYNNSSGTGYLVPNFENQTGLDPTHLATPELFTSDECDAQTKATFLSWIYEKKTEIGISAISSSYISANKENTTTHEWYTTINDVAYGMYLVKATNPNGRAYQVLALSAVPQLVGPSGGYYLTGVLDATLKYGDIKIDKTINKADSDIVRTDEVVDFDILCEVPAYQAISNGSIITDATELANYDWNENYKYAFTDDMSKAFDYVSDSLVLTYTTESMPKKPADIADDATQTEKDTYAAALSTYNTNMTAFNNSFKALNTGSVTTNTIFAPTYYYATTKLDQLSGVAVYSDSSNKDYLIFGVVTNVGTNNNTIAYYVFNKNNGTIEPLKDASGSALVYTSVTTVPASPSTEVKTRYAAQCGVTAGTLSRADTVEANDMRYVMAVSYDYDSLRTAPKTGTTEKTGATYVKISYQGKVTENCLQGTENNTNTGNIYYRYDYAGDYEKKSDTVHAYTYAVNIIKTDGKATTATYLEGAQFTLYKEAYIFAPKTTKVEAEDEETAPTAASGTTYAGFSFVGAATNDQYMGVTEIKVMWKEGEDDPELTTVTTLDKIDNSKNVTGLKYYYRFVSVDASACTLDGCAYKGAATAHQHVHVYEQIPLKKQTGKLADDSTAHIDVTGATAETVAGKEIPKYTIVSNDKSAGVTISGLENASYVLIEEKAPTGYNELTEAMRFEINSLSAEVKALNNAQFGTDRAFYSSIETTQSAQDAVKVNKGTAQAPDYKYYTGYTEGVYSINVKNYKGLTLPSTGGMGTMLFTIIGIIIMMIAMMVVILRNRKNANYQ